MDDMMKRIMGNAGIRKGKNLQGPRTAWSITGPHNTPKQTHTHNIFSVCYFLLILLQKNCGNLKWNK